MGLVPSEGPEGVGRGGSGHPCLAADLTHGLHLHTALSLCVFVSPFSSS